MLQELQKKNAQIVMLTAEVEELRALLGRRMHEEVTLGDAVALPDKTSRAASRNSNCLTPWC